MTALSLTWTEIEDAFGPLVEIPALPGGAWDLAAIHAADSARRLWTRVEPGLVSTGFHYVNREGYFLAAKAYPEGADICEVARVQMAGSRATSRPAYPCS